ncbi:MAG TPA: DapH/DapD/GlmU-related protein [Anaerolineae bacterium]|nr:DapH/DapD/GlmU-related protein [Anaerolineae bacterium]
MRKYIIEDTRLIPPFNERARELRVLNKPLWLAQRDALAPYTREERVVQALEQVPADHAETIVYRDNLFFDHSFIDEFIRRAREQHKACRVAFALNDKAITTHALNVQSGIRREGNVYVADLWYFPFGRENHVRPLVIDTQTREIGYYNIPRYMAPNQGDLTFQVPQRAFLSIEHWTHLFVANSPFGVFAEGARAEKQIERLRFKLRVLWRGLVERRHVLSSSALVKKGRNVHIDPSAVILGPVTLGDNVVIQPGAVIDNCHIGNNVTVSHGCVLMLSVIGDGCFLPWRASMFMTTLMENSMVAQNTCLQMCVIGRDTFIGAGNTFTDFNLVAKPIRVMHHDRLEEVGMPVIGGCVGHNCRIGSGFVIFPGRTIESDVMLAANRPDRVIAKSVTYEESDHHAIPGADQLFPAQYRPTTP